MEKLRTQLAKLRRRQFGQSSEKLSREIAQLELAIEEIEASEPVVTLAAIGEAADPGEGSDETVEKTAERRKPARRRLPNHLLRPNARCLRHRCPWLPRFMPSQK